MAIMNAAGTAWIAVITVIITADILGRTLFNAPLIGVPEIVKVSVVAIVWLQMAHTLKIGGHIRSDVVLDQLSPRGKAAVNVLAALLGTFVFGFLVYSAWPQMIEGWRVGEFEGELPVRVPTYPVRTILIVGAALTFVEFIVYGWRNARVALGGATHEAKP
jgi:TRAP-type mannitol/chloroaromatic compound transport system permease small subunit